MLSRVRLFATLWTAACQASLSFTISWSLLKLMPFESIVLSNHLIVFVPFSCLPFFPGWGSFPMSWLFTLGDQSIGASVIPMNIQGWFPLGSTGLISWLSKGLSRVFSSITVWKHQCFGAHSFLWSNALIHTWLLQKPYLWVCALCLCFLIFCRGLS